MIILGTLNDQELVGIAEDTLNTMQQVMIDVAILIETYMVI